MFYRYFLGCTLLTGLVGCSQHYTFFQSDARVATAAATPLSDTVQATAGRHYQRGSVHTLFFGKHYRSVWAAPVAVPVLQLPALNGGLRFVKRGGGFQTTSATLENPQGHDYALRTLDKDPYKTLPKSLRHTFVLGVVRDATSAANPYAALVVPHLADAAGVLHTNPRVFYVDPNETQLGTASEDMRGKLVMLEEKFDGPENLTPAFGKATDLIDSDDVLAERFADPTHQIDQLAFARARLLDILLGDWDRHDGQWQWAVYQQPNQTLYRPVPKDRDQVFYRFDDGIIPWIASRRWAVRKLRTFKPRYDDVEGLVRNARFLDTRALPEVSQTQFQELAHDLQQRLTDSVITTAIQQLPPTVYALEGARTIAALQARRAALPHAAQQFYRLLARRVEVVGTDKDEQFVVEHLSDSATRVSVYRLPGKKQLPAPTPFYQRTFSGRDTKQIALYGLRGRDQFIVRGTTRRAIRINIYGGPNEDMVTDSSRVGGWGKKVFFYDTKRGNELVKGPHTADRRRKGVATHAYDREGL